MRSRAFVLRKRLYAFESVATRICREGGARVTTNVLLRAADLASPNALDGKRFERVADALREWHALTDDVQSRAQSFLCSTGRARLTYGGDGLTTRFSSSTNSQTPWPQASPHCCRIRQHNLGLLVGPSLVRCNARLCPFHELERARNAGLCCLNAQLFQTS